MFGDSQLSQSCEQPAEKMTEPLFLEKTPKKKSRPQRVQKLFDRMEPNPRGSKTMRFINGIPR